MNPVPTRLLVDCSHAVRTRHRAGVQRVVWNLVDQARQQQSTWDAESTLVQDGRFWPFDPQRPLRSTQMRTGMTSLLPSWYRNTTERICQRLKSQRLRDWLLPPNGRLGIFRPSLFLQELGERRARRAESGWREPGAGDVLLLPDAYWCRKQVWPVVKAARDRGATVATVIYDLIPITHTQYLPAGSDASFLEYFRNAVDHSDMLIAISETVRDSCQQQITQRWPDKLSRLRLTHFELGADLPAEGSASDSIQRLFDPGQTQPPYLVVSTFDPRKNHAYLLDSFERFWQLHPHARLCLIGGRGWMSEDTISRIERHPRYQQQLFKFHGLPDADVRYCYQHACGVICPSIVEGFGLPIVEALAFGRRTFLSDTPIHREVGQHDCEYFDLSSPDSLAKLLVNWEKQMAMGSSLMQAVRKPMSWQESAAQIFSQCVHLRALKMESQAERTRATEFQGPSVRVA